MNYIYLVFALSFVIEAIQLAPEIGFLLCPHLCMPKDFTMCIAGLTVGPKNVKTWITQIF